MVVYFSSDERRGRFVDKPNKVFDPVAFGFGAIVIQVTIKRTSLLKRKFHGLSTLLY
jgi:hypothetical protein